MSQNTSSTVLTVLTALEVAVLLFFLARWYSRKWGWKNSFGRFRRYVRRTAVDLYRPVLQVYRFGAGVRLIGAQLSDPQLNGTLRTATGTIQRALIGSPDSWPFATLASASSIAVTVAGPAPTTLAGSWREHRGWWFTNRAALGSNPAFAGDISPDPLHVAIGVERDGLLLIDLNRVPGVLEIDGPHRAVFSLICALAAQLSAGLAGAAPGTNLEILISDGVHPKFAAPGLRENLERLEHWAAAGFPSDTVITLICGPLEPADAARVAVLVEQLPTLRVITSGPYAGTRWRLPLSPAGWIQAPELGLVSDAAPLERGVARALRLRSSGAGVAASQPRVPATLPPPEPVPAPAYQPAVRTAAAPVARVVTPATALRPDTPATAPGGLSVGELLNGPWLGASPAGPPEPAYPPSVFAEPDFTEPDLDDSDPAGRSSARAPRGQK